MFLFIFFFCLFGLVYSNSLLQNVKYKLGDIPPTALTLIKEENKRKKEESLKAFEGVVTKIVKDSRRQKRKRPVHKRKKTRTKQKPSKKVKAFQQKIQAQAQPLSNELRLLIAQQYTDPELHKKISVTLKNVNVCDAISLVSKLSGVNIIIDSDVKGKTTYFDFKDIQLSSLLKIIVNNNVPRLALIKDLDVWRIVKRSVAIDLLKIRENQLKEQDMVSGSFVMLHTEWDEKFKNRVQNMWKCIAGDKACDKGMYLFFDDGSKRIFYRARCAMAEDLTKCLREIDIRIPQVRIDVRVVLASKDFEEAFGFEWSGIYDRSASIKNFSLAGVGIGETEDDTGSFTDLLHWTLNFIPSGLRDSFSIKLPFVFGSKDFGTKRLNLLLNAAESRGEIETILKPTLLVKSDELAEILVGEEMPQEVRLQETVEGNPTNITTINYKDVGMKIRVKPMVRPDLESVFLDIYIENSEVVKAKIFRNQMVANGNGDENGDGNGNGNHNHGNFHGGVRKRFSYTIETTRSRSKVILGSGETTLIGGLIVKHQEKIRTGVPFIQRIPVIGWFFQGRRKVVVDKQLLIFLSPTLI